MRLLAKTRNISLSFMPGRVISPALMQLGRHAALARRRLYRSRALRIPRHFGRHDDGRMQYRRTNTFIAAGYDADFFKPTYLHGFLLLPNFSGASATIITLAAGRARPRASAEASPPGRADASAQEATIAYREFQCRRLSQGATDVTARPPRAAAPFNTHAGTPIDES